MSGTGPARGTRRAQVERRVDLLRRPALGGDLILGRRLGLGGPLRGEVGGADLVRRRVFSWAMTTGSGGAATPRSGGAGPPASRRRPGRPRPGGGRPRRARRRPRGAASAPDLPEGEGGLSSAGSSHDARGRRSTAHGLRPSRNAWGVPRRSKASRACCSVQAAAWRRRRWPGGTSGRSASRSRAGSGGGPRRPRPGRRPALRQELGLEPPVVVPGEAARRRTRSRARRSIRSAAVEPERGRWRPGRRAGPGSGPGASGRRSTRPRAPGQLERPRAPGRRRRGRA